MSWVYDETKVEIVMDGIRAGLSYGQAGALIGVSRHHVSGYMFRARAKGLDVPRVVKRDPVEKKQEGRTGLRKVLGPKKKTSPKTVGPPKLRASPYRASLQLHQPGLRITRTVRHGECRFPVSGVGADMMLCGQKAGGTYCVDHAKIAYMPMNKRDKMRPRTMPGGFRFGRRR